MYKSTVWLSTNFKIRTIKEMAECFDVSAETIRYWLKKHGIVPYKKRICAVCGKEFVPTRAEYYVCSKKCGCQKRKGKSSVENRVNLICLNCGKGFSRVKSAVFEMNFCSKKCDSEHKAKRYKGKRNPNWKGGLESGTKGQSGKGNRSYKSGRYFENKARKELEKLGYYVTRSGASKGVWDLIAINNWQIRLIQIKKNQLPRPSERKQMEDFVCPKNATKECWRYYSKGRRTLKQIYLYPHTEDSVDFFAEG